MDRSEIELATCLASLFMIFSLVSGVVLIILGSFDLASFLEVKRANLENIASICTSFPARSIYQNYGQFSVICPYTLSPLVLCFLSIFLQYLPFMIVKIQRSLCSNILWIMIRVISITSLIFITLELFSKDAKLNEFCKLRGCYHTKNSFDSAIFGILIFFEFSTTMLWITYYIKLRAVSGIRGRDSDIKEVKLVIIPSPQISSSDEKICSVCLDSINSKQDNAILNCGHKFHYSCIHDWLKKTLTCPVCRARPGEIKLPRSTLEPTLAISRD